MGQYATHSLYCSEQVKDIYEYIVHDGDWKYNLQFLHQDIINPDCTKWYGKKRDLIELSLLFPEVSFELICVLKGTGETLRYTCQDGELTEYESVIEFREKRKYSIEDVQ